MNTAVNDLSSHTPIVLEYVSEFASEPVFTGFKARFWARA